MERNLKDKVVVITGGAVGIGFEIADRYLEKGAKIAVLLDIDETQGAEALKTLTTKYGKDKAAFLKCDVLKNLEEISKKIFTTYKYVDVLVNNAGILDDTSAKKTIDINVTALIEWSMKFWEHMRKEKGGKGGTIINLASIYGFRIDQFLPVYQASKFAVMGFTKSLGHKYNYDRTGVRVVAICPGFTETKLTSNPKTVKDQQLQMDFFVFLKGVPWQKVDAVGRAAVEIFEKTNSGTAWLIEGAKPIVEVPQKFCESSLIEIMSVLIWTIAVLAVVIYFTYKSLAKFRSRGVNGDGTLALMIDSVKVFAGWQHFSDILGKNYHEHYEERFIGIYQFGMSLLQVHDLDLIKKITVKDFEHFVDRRNFAVGDPLFSRNLLTMSGNEWKEMRSNLSPAFTSSKIRLMVPFMVDVGDQMVLNLKKTIKESGSEYLEIDGKDLTTRYANDVIASCAFGLKVDSYSEPENEFYVRGLETVNFKVTQLLLMVVSMSLPWLSRALKIKLFSEQVSNFFTKLVLSTISNREKNNIVRPDMIHLLMEARKGKLVHDERNHDADAGFATVEESAIGKGKVHKEWSDVDLVAQGLIFFFAGFDTVSTAMSFLLYELAINPDVQDKLYQEIKENNAKNGEKFDFNSIQQMTYLDMVVSEGLRKWPPVPALDRVCVKDYNMGKPNANATEDFIMRKGEGMQLPIWGIHRDPKYFPNPEKFDPERFSEKNRHNIKPFSYFPFGLGPRNCIGSRFALCEVKVMVYQLLQHLEVSPGPRTSITNQLDSTKISVVIKGGHWLRFKIRN